MVRLTLQLWALYLHMKMIQMVASLLAKKGGVITVELDPLKSAKNGARATLFTEVQDFDIEGSDKALKQTTGFQYIGTIIRKNGHWEADKRQFPIPDFSYITDQAKIS
jgi:hypothetical protein